MPAKNTRRSAARDVHADFAAVLEANRKAHQWATKVVEYRNAGKTAQATAAERKAKHWLSKAMRIAAAHKTVAPHLRG